MRIPIFRLALGLIVCLSIGSMSTTQAQLKHNEPIGCGTYHANETNHFPDLNSEGQGIEETHFYFDRFGNRFPSLNLQQRLHISQENLQEGAESAVPVNNYTTANCQSTGGLFNLYFPDIQNGTAIGFDDPANAALVNVICQVFSDLDELIDQATDPCGGGVANAVNIEVLSFASTASILGAASSYYEFLGETSGIKHGEVWKAINGGDNATGNLDGSIRINVAYNWYAGLDGNPGNTQVDLYSVVLHEALHSLGFASLIGENGGSKLQFSGGTPVLTHYTPFDQFLKLDNGTALITNSSGYNWSYSGGNPGVNLVSSCQNPAVLGPDIRFNGVNNPASPVHAPADWVGASSLSHFQIGCDGASTDDYVMHPSFLPGTSRRITQEEIYTLCDLGYKLSGIYGTNSTLGGGFNPNQVAYNDCGALFAANDDVGVACSGGIFTVKRCNGNKLTILPNQLIDNDHFTGNVSIVNFEEVVTGTPLTVNGSNFEFTPTSVGGVVLRYQLQAQNGARSNYAYVFVNVLPCDGYNCTSTSTCNQICNPSMLDQGGDCGCSIVGVPAGCLEGWFRMYGTPDYAVSPPCPSQSTATLNYNFIPNNPGGHLLIAGYAPSQTTGIFNEGMLTPVSLTAGETYRVSLFVESFFLARDNSVGLDIGFLFESDIYWPLGTNQTVPLPTNAQLVGQIGSGEAGYTWQQFTFCFVAQDNYDRMFLQAFGINTVDQRIAIDQVELIEDDLAEIRTEYNTNCEQSIVIGADLCSISNQTYSWWDVADPANHVQLTNGAIVLGSTNDISLANASGSQLQVRVTRNRLFELRRDFIPIQGIPVMSSGCTDAIQVAVNLLTELKITKTVTNGSDFAKGSTVDYEITIENSTGSAVNNLKVNDVLAAAFDPSTVSFGANANVQTSVVGNELFFEVISLPVGAIETIVFSVDLTPNVAGGSLIRNCAGYEQDGCYFSSCADLSILPDLDCGVTFITNFSYSFFEKTPCDYQFSALVTADPACNVTAYNWNFGDPASGSANTASGLNAQHLYSSSGAFEVCLITELTCDGFVCYDTVCNTIEVRCEGEPCEEIPDTKLNNIKCATNANGDLLYEFSVHVWDPNNLINTATIASPQGTVIAITSITQGPPNGSVKKIVGILDPNGSSTSAFELFVSFPGTTFCTARVEGTFPECECAVSNTEVAYPECISSSFCVTVEFDYYGPANVPIVFYVDQANSTSGFSIASTIPANPILVNGHNTIIVCFNYTGDCEDPNLFFDALFIGIEDCKLWEMQHLECCRRTRTFKERLASPGTGSNDWVQLYPNPTTDAINLVFELEHATDKVDIALYDLTGRRVLQWENLSLSEGEHQIQWNIGSQLETGQYLLHLQIGDRKYSQSVLLSH